MITKSNLPFPIEKNTETRVPIIAQLPLDGICLVDKYSNNFSVDREDWDNLFYVSKDNMYTNINNASQAINWDQVESVLDLGCGCANFFEIIKDKNIKKMVGVDVTPEFIAICIGKKIPNSIYFCQGIENYKPDEKFDVIVILGVFVTMKNDKKIEKIISKLQECSKKGTQIIIIDYKIIIENYNIFDLLKKYNLVITPDTNITNSILTIKIEVN